jgi:TolB-like protein
MPSIIPGFYYDIFISYRQKDNKGERWVSEFVEALKTELESTFKEEVSVYFDINPHDGLLESHDVDASLEDKLKCLIFIPIISRTYCDPKSFAWEHEFKAFVELASHDQFGLKVKLPNGNVASRVLPVRIHDLDNKDINLCESVLGSVLRGIEFIYKEPGVNRSLSTKDHEEKNLNNTNYRNQINKVALAIKEIINSIGNYLPKENEVQKEFIKQIYIPRRKNKKTIITGSIIALALIALGVFLIPKFYKSAKSLEKSIAVLPFKSLSDDPEKQYLADGIMEDITLHLSKIKDLRVMSRTSVEQYRGTIKTSQQIGKELDVEYLLEGSFQKFGDDVKLIVQLIKTSKESHVWGNESINKWSDIFSLQSEVAQKIASELNAVITPQEKLRIEKLPTRNLAAYDAYLKGYYYFFGQNTDADSAMKYYELAKEIDPEYALAYAGISFVWQYRIGWGTVSIVEGSIKSVESIKKAQELDSTYEIGRAHV